MVFCSFCSPCFFYFSFFEALFFFDLSCFLSSFRARVPLSVCLSLCLFLLSFAHTHTGITRILACKITTNFPNTQIFWQKNAITLVLMRVFCQNWCSLHDSATVISAGPACDVTPFWGSVHCGRAEVTIWNYTNSMPIFSVCSVEYHPAFPYLFSSLLFIFFLPIVHNSLVLL